MPACCGGGGGDLAAPPGPVAADANSLLLFSNRFGTRTVPRPIAADAATRSVDGVPRIEKALAKSAGADVTIGVGHANSSAANIAIRKQGKDRLKIVPAWYRTPAICTGGHAFVYCAIDTQEREAGPMTSCWWRGRFCGTDYVVDDVN
ncbi:Protein P [Frankliniella fusca]|uniref:Protein P n=1 Tax=Frankliniella fusca TaxID=407009 RepID=A0AAE1H1C2_9NEOP|nr:Protein P [Frankliniella fusca]